MQPSKGQKGQSSKKTPAPSASKGQSQNSQSQNTHGQGTHGQTSHSWDSERSAKDQARSAQDQNRFAKENKPASSFQQAQKGQKPSDSGRNSRF